MERILIIRQQNNQLGDLLCALPLYYAIKKKFPESSVSLIAGKTNYNIPYSKFCPFIDNLIQMDRETFRKNIDFIREVRALKCNIGIIPSTMQFSRTSHVINFLSGAKIRVGVKQFDNYYNKSAWLLNKTGVFEWGKNKVHQIDRILDIAKLIECDLVGDEKRIQLHYTNEEIKAAKDFLNNNFPGNASNTIAMHPGAGKISNRWDPDNFVLLAKKLYDKCKCELIITSGNIDKEVTDKMIKGLKSYGIPFVLIENFDIRILGAILSMINLFITNDTGVMHLAGFSGGKVLSLFGPTEGYEWAPQQNGCRFIQSNTEMINDISVDEVLINVLEMIRFKE